MNQFNNKKFSFKKINKNNKNNQGCETFLSSNGYSRSIFNFANFKYEKIEYSSLWKEEQEIFDLKDWLISTFFPNISTKWEIEIVKKMPADNIKGLTLCFPKKIYLVRTALSNESIFLAMLAHELIHAESNCHLHDQTRAFEIRLSNFIGQLLKIIKNKN